MKSRPSYLDLGVFIALLLCGLALYFVPLQSTSFYFDDRSSIVNNEAIKTIDIPKIFSAFNTRFLPGLSFALNYSWCGLHAGGWRLINLLIHCFNAFLVYLLIKSFYRALEWPAFFASLLFLCHPVQTEAVNSITQRFVLMGSFFYLSTLLLYIQYRYSLRKLYVIAALITALAAMLCKEFTVTLPLMITLYEFCFLNSFNETVWKRCRRLIPFFVITLIVPALLLRTPKETVRAANIADSNLTHNHIDITRAKGSIGRKQYFLTELNVMCTYVRLLILPINQNFDYDYPLSSQIDLKTLLCVILLLCLLAAVIIAYNTYRIVSFSILWFFIALSVESSFIPIGHVIAEYRLYLAVYGFVFLVMSLLYIRKMNRKKANMIAAAILISCSILTFQRNDVWKNEFTLWDDTVKKSPHKARPYNNRGLEYFRQGKFDQAISDFNTAIEINPDYAAAYNNRGVLYGSEGRFTEALSDFDKAIAINPGYTDARNNRDFTYYQLRK